MLFEDFTKQEAIEMLNVARNLIISDTLPFPLPDFVNLWMDELQCNDDQKYLILATAFSQRVLLSLIESDNK
jgi:hypothetical protein